MLALVSQQYMCETTTEYRNTLKLHFQQKRLWVKVPDYQALSFHLLTELSAITVCQKPAFNTSDRCFMMSLFRLHLQSCFFTEQKKVISRNSKHSPSQKPYRKLPGVLCTICSKATVTHHIDLDMQFGKRWFRDV